VRGVDNGEVFGVGVESHVDITWVFTFAVRIWQTCHHCLHKAASLARTQEAVRKNY